MTVRSILRRTVSCDTCNTEVTLAATSAETARKEAKAEGWSFIASKAYPHYTPQRDVCPACTEASAKAPQATRRAS